MNARFITLLFYSIYGIVFGFIVLIIGTSTMPNNLSKSETFNPNTNTEYSSEELRSIYLSKLYESVAFKCILIGSSSIGITLLYISILYIYFYYCRSSSRIIQAPIQQSTSNPLYSNPSSLQQDAVSISIIPQQKRLPSTIHVQQ